MKVLIIALCFCIVNFGIFQLNTEGSITSHSKEKELEELNIALTKQVELLERRLQAVAIEGEQSNHRFQVYADQCTSQISSLRQQVPPYSSPTLPFSTKNDVYLIFSEIFPLYNSMVR